MGWRNYHEQWLSEGFAQYFAALYAQQRRGDESFTGVMRQISPLGDEQSDQGPISLGYRLGHIKATVASFAPSSTTSAPRSCTCCGDWSAMRRSFGPPPVLRHVPFQKAGTDDFRDGPMETETRPVARSFLRPVDLRIDPAAAESRLLASRRGPPNWPSSIEQLGEVFDCPLTMTLEYADKKRADMVIPVTEQVTDRRMPLSGAVQDVEVNSDDGTLAEFVK